jgi:hypothetical protein
MNLSMTGSELRPTTQPSAVDTKPFNNISIGFGINVEQNRGSSGIDHLFPLTWYYSQILHFHRYEFILRVLEICYGNKLPAV